MKPTIQHEGVSRREFLYSCAAVGMGSLAYNTFAKATATGHEKKKPNILFILTDDQGYADLSYMGHPVVKTPFIDDWSTEGARFDQFYAASCTCTPTRMSCLTGRYPWVFDCGYAGQTDGFVRGVYTTANLLKLFGGYKTGFIGKWHVGGNEAGEVDKRLRGERTTYPSPTERGFDDAYFWEEGGCFHNDETAGIHQYSRGAQCILHNDQPLDPPFSGKNLIEANTDLAIKLIEDYHSSGSPFFIQLSYYAVHKAKRGYDNLPECGQQYTQYENKDYFALIDCLDKGVGRLREKLDQLGITDNTFVIYASDNGPTNNVSTGGLRGTKWSTWEGGVRVPAWAVWPGKIQRGMEVSDAAITNDLLPTFCELAGVALPEDGRFDGLSLLPRLVENIPIPKRPLYFYRSPTGHKDRATNSIVEGKWKLDMRDEAKTVMGLFDVEEDKFEKNDMAAQHPDIVSSLQKKMKDWIASANGDFVTHDYLDKLEPVGVTRHMRTVPHHCVDVFFGGSGSLILSVSINKNARVKAAIFDTKGRFLLQIYKGNLNKGNHRFHVRCRELKRYTGISKSVIFRIKINSTTLVRKFVL